MSYASEPGPGNPVPKTPDNKGSQLPQTCCDKIDLGTDPGQSRSACSLPHVHVGVPQKSGKAEVCATSSGVAALLGEMRRMQRSRRRDLLASLAIHSERTGPASLSIHDLRSWPAHLQVLLHDPGSILSNFRVSLRSFRRVLPLLRLACPGHLFVQNPMNCGLFGPGCPCKQKMDAHHTGVLAVKVHN